MSLNGAVRTLVVWCPDWPVVAITAAAAAAGCVPVAVVAANRVVACSAAARVEGVQRGLRRRQAEARCPGLNVVPDDPGTTARAFESVVAAVETFSPRVEIVRPGVCALATRGPSRYFGGDEALVARIAEAVDAVLPDGAPRCRVGVADGRFAAERAARHGVAVVPPAGSAAFLASFPVATLEMEDLAGLFIRLGIRTLGDLAALPAKAVLARFGPEGAVAHRLARGLDERPLAARTPPPDLTVTAELDPPAERIDTIAFVARSLAARLRDELTARGLALSLIRVEAETEHGESLSRCWRLDHSVAPLTAASLAERVRWQLDGWLAGGAGGTPTGPVTLLRLVPEEVRPHGGRQAGFWGGDRAAAERAARALERVQGKLGPQAVAVGAVVGGRSPAEQVRLVPWGDPLPVDPSAASPWPGRLPAPAPATVPSRPLPAEVVDAGGRPVTVTGRGACSGPPARLSVDGGPWTEVSAWAGPWLVDERWWDAAAHRRRARWQVVTVDGTAHLLCVEGGRWSVEAIYD
jgi:protein ImuB